MGIIYQMDMPVFMGTDYGTIYGQISEGLVIDILENKNKHVQIMDYHCPIDIIIDKKYGAEIKYRWASNRTIVSFTKRTRQLKLEYCKKLKLKPITILVSAISQGQVKITVRSGIKNIHKGFEGIDLEEFLNAMDCRESANNPV